MTGDQRATRRAPHMERYVEIEPRPTLDEPEAHIVRLKIGTQSFDLNPEACGSRCDALWMRDMLCIALDRLVAGHQSAAASSEAVSEADGPNNGHR